MTQPGIELNRRRGRGEACADFESARSRPIWIAVRALPVREQNLLRFCYRTRQREAQVQRLCHLGQLTVGIRVFGEISAPLQLPERPH